MGKMTVAGIPIYGGHTYNRKTAVPMMRASRAWSKPGTLLCQTKKNTRTLVRALRVRAETARALPGNRDCALKKINVGKHSHSSSNQSLGSENGTSFGEHVVI